MTDKSENAGSPHRTFWLPALYLVLVLLVAATVATYVARDPERRVLDEAARAEAPGRFMRLADGLTHFEVAGPDTGRVVLLAAAFSVPAYIWDPLFQQLADAGFRVIRFDYYGRGWSDRIDATYDQDLFVRQMAGLLDSLGVRTKVTIAGLSYGAAMVTSFADRYPERVRAIVYLDPVFNNRRPLPPRERSRLAWNVYMVMQRGSEALAQGQLEDFLHPELHLDWVERYRVQQQFKGTREAWRRTRAAIAEAPDQAEQLRHVGEDPRPVLVVWGRQDPGVSFADIEAAMAALPRAALLPVDSAAHLPHIEQPAVVGPAVLRFLVGIDLWLAVP
jgi:pimeloyl-ACP methyl ester carboxylesterase